jgi:hypothetical protein
VLELSGPVTFSSPSAQEFKDGHFLRFRNGFGTLGARRGLERCNHHSGRKTPST